MFRNMFRNTSIMSVSLAAVLAAGTAGIFTAATAPSQNDLRVNRVAKENLGREDMSSVFFNSQPIASSGRMINQSPPSALRRVGSERIESQQTQPQRANENQDSMPMAKGCESGLSPDISTTVPQSPGRCVV